MINWDNFNYDRTNKVFWIEDSGLTDSSREILKKIGFLDGYVWKIPREKLGFELLTEAELIQELEKRFVGFMLLAVRTDSGALLTYECGHPILLKGIRTTYEELVEDHTEED